MQWFVSHQGQTIGPHDGQTLYAKVQQLTASGQSLAGAYVREETGAWMPIEQSPFASALGQRSATPAGVTTPAPSAATKKAWLRPVAAGGGFLVFVLLAKCGIDSGASKMGRATGDAAAAKLQFGPGASATATTAAVPAPEPEPSPLVPAVDLSKRLAIKRSRADFRSWFQRLGVQLKSSPLADGTPRELGQHGMLIVEAIGYGDLLERASLTFGVAANDMESAAAATGAIFVFMRETGWEKGGTWVTGNLQKPKGATKTMNGVKYEISPVVEGMYVLSAKPAGAAD